MWYEAVEGFPKKPEIPLIESVCPVCNITLGWREEMHCGVFFCRECNVQFTFIPGVDKPYSVSAAQLKEECDCYNCKARKNIAKKWSDESTQYDD